MDIPSLTTALAALALAQDPAPPAEDRPDAETIRLFDYDREADLDVEEIEFEDFDDYMVVDLAYASPGGGRVPAWLYTPTDDGPHAGIVMMHGMPGSRDNSRMLAPGWVKTGAVVIAISAPWARPGRADEDIVSFTEKDRLEQIQLIQDLRRAVDLLEEEPTVDPDRIGYVGGSYGGAMGGLLAGVEHRIKAYVLAVGDGGLVDHMTGPEDQGGRLMKLSEEQREAWLAMMRPIEPIRFVRLAAPSDLLFQNGKVDEMVPARDAARYQAAGSEPKTIKWYETGHGLTPEVARDQVTWLAARIGLDAEKYDMTPPRRRRR